MKVLVLSQYYPPEPVYIPQSVAQHLAAAGSQVRVVTGFPNYPTGKIYPGYQQKWRHFELDGRAEVLRVPLWTDHSESALRRICNYLSFSFSSLTARRYYRDCDVIYVYATQMTAAFAAWIQRLFGGAPYILHVQDLWPDSVIGSSILRSSYAQAVVGRVLRPWLNSVFRRSSAVIAIAPTMAKTLVARGVPEDRIRLVYNWAEDGLEVQTADSSEGDCRRRQTNIVYAGNIGDMQDLETAIRAAHAARDAGMTLTLVGDGLALSRIKNLAESLGALNIVFHRRVPREEMERFYRSADYCLITLKDLPAFGGTIPSKLQSSLARGIPIITTVQGDVRSLVEDRGLGLTAAPESPEDLERAFREAVNQTPEERKKLSVQAKEVHEELFLKDVGLRSIGQTVSDVRRRGARRSHKRSTRRQGKASAAS